LTSKVNIHSLLSFQEPITPPEAYSKIRCNKQTEINVLSVHSSTNDFKSMLNCLTTPGFEYSLFMLKQNKKEQWEFDKAKKANRNGKGFGQKFGNPKVIFAESRLIENGFQLTDDPDFEEYSSEYFYFILTENYLGSENAYSVPINSILIKIASKVTNTLVLKAIKQLLNQIDFCCKDYQFVSETFMSKHDIFPINYLYQIQLFFADKIKGAVIDELTDWRISITQP
jgi:hypothetical protein